MSGRILVFGVAAFGVGVFACTGGPGAPGDLDSPWSQKPNSTFEQAPSTAESPSNALDPAPAPTDRSPASTGSASGGGCPPCGTYLCQGTETTTVNGQTSTSTVTVPIPLQKQADGTCAFIEKSDAVILTCNGSITDGSGKVIGSWTASGNSVTLTASDASVKATTCTVSAKASTNTAPTATVTPVPPPPTASPPIPTVDAGF